ncbi:MAG: peptidoglycan endopeptidase [Burkholderiales bacterium]|nr:MAG: peptidoglycan endopeptidase [Burkholderiales bacterium]
MKPLAVAALLSSLACHALALPSQGEYADMESLLAGKGLAARAQAQLADTRESASEMASSLVISAMSFLGVPYRYGGNSREAGLDCSGFVRLVFEQSVGKVLPRRAAEQAAATHVIGRQELQPGDLVFFNTMRRAFSHVGIYVGEGRFIHAPRAGAQVRVEDMRTAYWSERFNGARRVLAGDAVAIR